MYRLRVVNDTFGERCLQRALLCAAEMTVVTNDSVIFGTDLLMEMFEL